MFLSTISLRPAVTFLALAGLLSGPVEAGVGEARDGIVHHEDAVRAVAHRDLQGFRGEHGHEDGTSSDRSDDRQEHQHGTAVDHCTHVHGTGLIAAVTVVLEVPFAAAPAAGEFRAHACHAMPPGTEPPRA